MSLYKCALIARNDVTQQQVESIVSSIAGQLETEGGAMIKREYWGLRSLACRIKKNRKGHYLLMGFDAKPAFVSEMEIQVATCSSCCTSPSSAAAARRQATPRRGPGEKVGHGAPVGSARVGMRIWAAKNSKKRGPARRAGRRDDARDNCWQAAAWRRA